MLIYTKIVKLSVVQNQVLSVQDLQEEDETNMHPHMNPKTPPAVSKISCIPTTLEKSTYTLQVFCKVLLTKTGKIFIFILKSFKNFIQQISNKSQKQL